MIRDFRVGRYGGYLAARTDGSGCDAERMRASVRQYMK